MPDFAPNYTHRIRVSYRAAGANHSQLWRVLPPADVTTRALAFGTIQSFYDSLSSVLADDAAVLSVTEAFVDSDIFLPAGFALTMTGSLSMATFGPSKKASATSWVGRSVAGLRAIVFMYGLIHNMSDSELPGNDFRVTAAESAYVADSVGVLNGGSTGLAANDGNPVSWYSYVNVKYNDYWVRKVRQGS